MKKTFILILLSFLSFHTFTSAQVDSTIGLGVSGSANYAVLAHQLTDGVQGERMKVNAIYNWITHNIKYDVKALKKTTLKPDEVPTVLKKRKAVCDGYSKLFTALCEEAGIKAVTIEGYAKDWMFDNGDQFYIPRHAWNAVYVEGRWHLVEATWGAGHLVQEPSWFKKLFGGKKNPTTAGGRLKFKFRYDPKWMLMDPLTFRKDHLPTDPLWQLTDSLMPISIFEAGDTAIMNFNKQNNILVQNLPDLDRINKLDELKRTQETADRITQYNPRYRVEMAAKYNADAIDSLEKTLKEKNDPTQALNNAKEELKKAEKEIAAQKSTISTEYSVLKKKNKTKSLDAKEHIRLLRSDNKRLIANCKSKINTANSKIKSIGDKEDKNVEKSASLAKGSKTKQTAARKETDAASPELLSIEDNVALMIGKIEDLKEDINKRNELITETKKDNDRRLDSLVLCFRLCDSALVKETIARLQMHDDMDDEVIKWNSIVKQNRLQDLDSLQKYFIAGYDTVLNNYDALRKSQYAQLEEYRKAFKELDKYKRRNNSNTAFLSQYTTLVDDYNNSNEAYMQLLSDNKVYIMEHKSLFGNIVDLYKRQEKLAEYMEKAENMRKKLEEKNLAHKEEFDKKENEKQRESIKQTTKRIEKVLASK